MFKFLRRPLFALLLTLPGLFGISQRSTRMHAAALPMISDEEYKAMSPAQRKEFEQKMKEQIEQMSPAEQEGYMQQVVETLFESLTPEQQKEVLEEAERIEKMSEEEQRAYFKQVERDLDQAFGKQQGQAPAPRPEPEPELKPEPKVKKEEIVSVKISAQEKALKEAINLINEISQAIDDLLVKIERKEDFLYKVGKWGKKKKIKSWDGKFKWDKLKKKIDTLRGNIDKLKDRDTKTKKHKYLPGFIGDEKLYATIYNLSVDLADHEPSVRSGKGELLPKKVRKRSHKALRALINVFTSLLFPKKSEDDLIASLDKLFAKYDPEAKKIAAEEKTAAQRALERSKRPGQPSRVRTAGRGRGTGYEPSGLGFGFYEEPDMVFGAPGYTPYEQHRGAKADRAPGKKVTPTPAPSKKPGKPKTEEKKKEELQKDERLNKFLKRFDRNIEAILDTILDNPNLEKLDNYMATNVVDINLARRSIPDLNSLIRKATSGLERIKSRIGGLPKASQKSYKKDIKGLIKSIQVDIEKLVRSIDKVGITGLSANMKWAHFGQPKPQPAGLTADVQALTSPTTLPMLKESAQEFLKKARNFIGR